MNDPKVLLVDDAPEQGRAVSVGCDAMVGGGVRVHHKAPLLVAHLAMMAAICGGLPPGLAGRSREPREKTPEDFARIAAAKAKQERKRALKEAQKTKAPNKADRKTCT